MSIPFFPTNQETNKIAEATHKKNKTRWDKTHPMKYPVNVQQEIEIRKLWKQHKNTLELIENKNVSMTKFNTMLLRFGLRNKEMIHEQPYKDTGTYKTVKPNQVEYEIIGGSDGLATQWVVSERRALTYIMESVLSYLRSGGKLSYENIKPFKPSK